MPNILPTASRSLKEQVIQNSWEYILQNFHKFSEYNKIKVSLAIMSKDLQTPLIDQSQHTHILVKVEGVDGDKIPLTQGAVTSIQR